MWRHYLKGSKYKIFVLIDHNIIYHFMNIKTLSFSPVWWVQDIMPWSQDLRLCDQTTWLTSKRTDLILSNSLLSSTCHACSKMPSSSTCYRCNSSVTITFVIIKSPPFNSTLLSPSEKEVLHVIELIKRNACTIRFIKRLLANQCLTWPGGKAKGVNSCLVIPLEVLPLYGERIVS